MAKVSLSVTVDNEIINLIDGRKNKSETINQILKRALRTEEGIRAEIEHHQSQMSILTKDLEQLIQRNKDRIEKISEQLKSRLHEVKRILTEHPDKADIWTEIINRNYEQDITKDDLRKLIERWC